MNAVLGDVPANGSAYLKRILLWQINSIVRSNSFTPQLSPSTSQITLLSYALFDGMRLDRSGDEPTPRLSIRVGGFDSNTTLANFVQWASLFFDGPLALKHFHDPSPWKEKKMNSHKDECNNTNWRIVYTGDTLVEGAEEDDARYVEILLRELQAMATNESMLEHREGWNLVDRVFEWLNDYLYH
jgi:hypothetical protein